LNRSHPSSTRRLSAERPRRSTPVAANSPAEGAAYKDAILKTAQVTAEATKDGGFLGIGGTLVSADEQVALDAIKNGAELNRRDSA
jgi:hypothetical protein